MRNKEIYKLHTIGKSSKFIASKFNLTVSTINKLIAKMRGSDVSLINVNKYLKTDSGKTHKGKAILIVKKYDLKLLETKAEVSLKQSIKKQSEAIVGSWIDEYKAGQEVSREQAKAFWGI